ncbi:unnamed protein product [Rotaria sp. Silwood1]|nr:unnamed protein product [Rotaria sp. Silwood1]
MITSQRVIIYRTETNQDESDYEITEVYDFSSIINVLVIEDENRRPYIEFLHNQPQRSNKITTITTSGKPCQRSLLRCDLHDRAIRLTRDIQRAREIFEEEKFTYIPPDDENNDEDNDDITNEQQLDETVQMT